MTKVGCSSCAKRREKLKRLREKKKAKGQDLQAAAIGAVLSVTETIGNQLGIHGEVEDEQVLRTREQQDRQDSGQ